MKSYDIIFIGTGQATGTVLPELLRKKLKIAVVESDRVGGTCVNWGCTPTKTLVASARAAYMARRGPDFGVETEKVSVNFQKVMERVNAIRFTSSDEFKSWLQEVVIPHPTVSELVPWIFNDLKPLGS